MHARAPDVPTRSRILTAARAIVDASGPAALTLEEVARRAGLSKGGLLYHFPGKDALVNGMIEEALSRFDADVEERAKEEAAGPGQWLRAFVRLTFDARPEHNPGAGILAAAATNPELLKPVGRYFDRWQTRAAANGLPADVVGVVRLAADGLWFADMFNAAAPDGHLREQVLTALLSVIEEAEQTVIGRN